MTTDVVSKCSQPEEKVKTPAMSEMSKNHIIYARFDRKPPPRDEIRLLNPAIIDVRFPRQKSAKFVFLEFETQEAANLAFKQMKKTHNKMTFKSLSKNKAQGTTKMEMVEETEENANDANDAPIAPIKNVPIKDVPINPKSCKCLHVTGLPLFATEEVLRSMYPINSEISISKQNFKGKKQGYVSFSSAEEATEAFKASKDINVNGEPLTITLHKGSTKK